MDPKIRLYSSLITANIVFVSIKQNPMADVLIYVAAPSFIVSLLSIIIIISSFRLEKAIRKNLPQLADQLKSFGAVVN